MGLPYQSYQLHSALSEIVSLDKAHKAVIKSVLAGHTVAMVTCCDTKMITCLPLIGQFIDTTIVALIIISGKGWLQRPIKL